MGIDRTGSNSYIICTSATHPQSVPTGTAITDGEPQMDFPTPTCSFVLNDGTVIVADAPAPTQPLNDVHVFTDDAQHVSFGTSQPFDDVIGTVFVQKDDGSFYGLVSRDVGTTNPNPVHKTYTDVA